MAEPRREWFRNQIFRHRKALARYLRKLNSDTEDIEDLIQETYLRAYSFPVCNQLNSPRALLFKIAHNLCMERARRDFSQAPDRPEYFSASGINSSEAPAVVRPDEPRRLQVFCAAVDRLPPLCRRAFVLRKLYRLSHDEIAEVLGVSHSTIEKQMAKGLLQCRDYLKRAGLLDPDEVRPSSPPSRLRDRRDFE